MEERLLASARSLLFVPGHRPDRFERAATSGADGIVLDIEDAVAAGDKLAARENIGRWLRAGRQGIVRINGVETMWHEDDLLMLQGLRCVVMLPKASTPDQALSVLSRLAPGSLLMPLLETAVGILDARKICSVTGAVRAVFGNADLARELDIDLNDRPALSFARSQVVLASAACGIHPPVDGVTTSLRSETAVIADAQHSVSLGFTGKLCVHPAQVAPVNAAFTPSTEELEWAQIVVSAAGDGSVANIDGQIVGKPIVDRARRLLSSLKVQHV